MTLYPKGSDTHVSQHGQLIVVENDIENNGSSSASSFSLLFKSFSHNLKKPKSWLVVRTGSDRDVNDAIRLYALAHASEPKLTSPTETEDTSKSLSIFSRSQTEMVY